MKQNRPQRHSKPSVMKHDFSRIPKVTIPRSSFDRSHGHKLTFEGGLLIPVLVDEALPGDTFSLKMTALARLATPLFPTMDNMTLSSFFFAVPNRLLWDNWEKFNGAQEDPDDSIDFNIPVVTNTAGVPENSLHDYMGIPPGVATLPFNALAARAYMLIYDTWFRDENLQDSLKTKTNNGPDTVASHVLQRRGKRKDYFTSALPWPQKGDSVELPLGTSAPVIGTGDDIPTFLSVAESRNLESVAASTAVVVDTATAASAALAWDDTKLIADLSTATAATINAIRQAFQIQKLLERDARGGTRYTEIIRSHFGVTSPDSRLQRPEYLGGGTTPINITPVTQNSFNTPPNFVGDLGGYGTGVMKDNAFTQSFTEHCMIIGLVSVQADLSYQQGLDRMWSRQTRYDFYWPSLSHIGEQSILNKEIYAQGDSNDPLTFGYQERFAEYRYKNSLITGKMRSAATGTLDPWHLSQDFSALPVLNAAFIEDTPPIDRIIAIPTEPHFKMDIYFSMRCARPMPMYGVPGMMDHF